MPASAAIGPDGRNERCGIAEQLDAEIVFGGIRPASRGYSARHDGEPSHDPGESEASGAVAPGLDDADEVAFPIREPAELAPHAHGPPLNVRPSGRGRGGVPDG